MNQQSLKMFNAAKKVITSNGYKVNSVKIVDNYGISFADSYRPYSKYALRSIESAEETTGVETIYANFNNDIIVKTK